MPSDLSPLNVNGQPRPRKFVVTLSRSTDGTVLVKSCEVIGDGFRNRTSFQQDAALRQVFKQAIARGIAGSISGLTGENEVRSYPELRIETAGLLLMGLHLIVTPAENDQLHIICRFGAFLGGVNHAFRAQIGFDGAANDERERLTALVFADLVLPVLNICQSAQQVAEQGVLPTEPMARALSDKWDELQFRVELLKRFVEFTPHGDAPNLNKAVPAIRSDFHTPQTAEA